MLKNISRQTVLLLIVLIIASFFRLYNLSGTNSAPPGLYPDEAINGNNASEALDTGNFKVFYPENNGREGLFINIQAVSIKIFGNKPLALRLPSAIFGILTILGIYLFSATLFNNASIGLLSAFFTAISFWHINFSRIGFRAIMAPFLLVWALYLLIKSLNSIRRKSDFIEVQPPKYYHRFLRRLNLAKFEGKLSFQKLKIKKWTLPALAGFVYGLGFYTYIAYRGTPLLILCIFYYYYKYCRQNHSHILQNMRMIFLVFAIAAIFAILPLGIYFFNHPQDFLGHASQLSISNSATPLKDLVENILKTAGMFNFSGDTNWRHNFAGKPELYWPVGIMFVFGILYGLWQIIKNLKPFSVIASAAKAISSVIPHLPPHASLPPLARLATSGAFGGMRNPEKELNSRCSLPSSHIGGGNDIRGFEFLILFSWLIITALPVVISNEGIPHALRSLLMIPPVFILAGAGAYKMYELLINKIPGFYHKHDEFVKNSFILLCALLIVQSYNYYFLEWGNNPNVKYAFRQDYVAMGEMLNSLPKEIMKYVVLENNDIKVRGIPMPAQTVMFITDTFTLKKQAEKNIHYLLPDQEKDRSENNALFLYLK